MNNYVSNSDRTMEKPEKGEEKIFCLAREVRESLSEKVNFKGILKQIKGLNHVNR